MVRKDISHGIVPFRIIEGVWQVLLVQHISGSWWGFPKGHAEEGEPSQQAAERELFEETQLTVESYLSHTPLIENYTFSLKGETIDKSVWYYPALVKGTAIFQQSELLSLKWVVVAYAEKEITYEESRRVFRKAVTLLTV
jgi:bis(5'-nucleosidyl)-tetraphosphatase